MSSAEGLKVLFVIPRKADLQDIRDFVGPVFVKVLSISVENKEEIQKSYICLFTRGASRALHLELVPNLTAGALNRCLHRYKARRGIPVLLPLIMLRPFNKQTRTRVFYLRVGHLGTLLPTRELHGTLSWTKPLGKLNFEKLLTVVTEVKGVQFASYHLFVF